MATPWTGFGLALLTGILWAGNAIVFRHTARKGHDIFVFLLLFNGLAACAAWFGVDWSLLSAGDVQRPWTFVSVMTWAGLNNQLGMFLLIYAMKHGTQSVVWTIAQSALVLPFTVGVLLFSNPASALNVSGICILLGGIVMVARKRNGASEGEAKVHTGPWLLCAFGALLVNGVTQTLCTLPSQWQGWEDTCNLRIPLLLTSGALLLLIICLKQKRRAGKTEWKLGATGALIMLVSLRCSFGAMDALRPTGQVAMAYPMFIGASIIALTLASRLFLKERLPARALAGILLAIIGVLLIGIRTEAEQTSRWPQPITDIPLSAAPRGAANGS
jgi:drug/metabolite transporter (DMT)-like permease